MTPMWQKALADRGYLDAALAAGVKPDGNGWAYPVAEGVIRWKAFDSHANPKYFWKGDGERPKYYLCPGTQDAIIEAGGVIIASGEPDVWTYQSAGIRNVICWFGEQNVPPTLAEDLLELGASWVRYYPDLDSTGSGSAYKVCSLLAGQLEVFIGRLPAELGEAGDINKLWQSCKFDTTVFTHILEQCPRVEIQDIRLPLANTSTEDEHRDFPPDYYTAIEQALGVESFDGDGWSKNVRCPMRQHEHDHVSPAFGWNHVKHIGKCFKCQQEHILAKEVGAALGIDYREYLPKKERARDALPPEQPKKPNGIYSWNQATDRVVSELLGDVDDSVREPLPIPFHGIAYFHGLAERLLPRKMMAVVGDSGDGKTSLTETMVDHWRKSGFSGVMFGPEWSMTEYVYRAIQRAGGPSYNEAIEHKAWCAARKRGVPGEKRPGRPFTDGQSDLAINLAEEIRCWPGKLWFVEKMAIKVDELLTRLGEIVVGAQSQGERVSFVVVDYAQLLRSGGNASESIDRALSDFKSFCVDNDLVGVVASQVPKEAGKEQASGNAKLTQHTLQNARADYFNLVLTINRELNEAGERMPMATIRIAKNSLGKTGETQLFLNEERLMWFDVKRG